jgi:hypothetical protein
VKVERVERVMRMRMMGMDISWIGGTAIDSQKPLPNDPVYVFGYNMLCYEKPSVGLAFSQLD